MTVPPPWTSASTSSLLGPAPAEAERFDAVVIGAGPAGSMAARRLAQEGHRVVLLERESLPRYKPCGGGLTPRSVVRLPFDIRDVPHRRIHRISFRLNGSFPATLEVPQGAPFYMVMRSDLDQALARAAMDAGALLHDRSRVVGLHSLSEGYLVQTEHRAYLAPYVVAADGATGPSRRLLGLPRQPKRGIAIECELGVGEDLLEQFAETAVFDMQTGEGGYGWIFPKADHLSVGVVTMGRPRASLRLRLRQFLVKSGLASDTEADGLVCRAHPLPLSKRGAPCRVGGVLLAGDAAGLADGLAGEGICYALASGDLAGAAIARSLRGDRTGVSGYEAEIDRLIRRDHAYAHFLGRVLHWFPSITYQRITSLDEGRQALMALMLGQESFAESVRYLVPLALRRLVDVRHGSG